MNQPNEIRMIGLLFAITEDPWGRYTREVGGFSPVHGPLKGLLTEAACAYLPLGVYDCEFDMTVYVNPMGQALIQSLHCPVHNGPVLAEGKLDDQK